MNIKFKGEEGEKYTIKEELVSRIEVSIHHFNYFNHLAINYKICYRIAKSCGDKFSILASPFGLDADGGLVGFASIKYHKTQTVFFMECYFRLHACFDGANGPNFRDM